MHRQDEVKVFFLATVTSMESKKNPVIHLMGCLINIQCSNNKHSVNLLILNLAKYMCILHGGRRKYKKKYN